MTSDSKSVYFNLPGGAEYCMKLLSFSHINNQMEATVEAEPEVWEYIDLLMFFNLKWDVRKEGTISGIKPVQLKIFLDKKLYESLKLENRLITEEKKFLEADSDHPMRGVMNWFATEATEEVDLPDSLKELGSLREGFTTKWKEVYK